MRLVHVRPYARGEPRRSVGAAVAKAGALIAWAGDVTDPVLRWRYTVLAADAAVSAAIAAARDNPGVVATVGAVGFVVKTDSSVS